MTKLKKKSGEHTQRFCVLDIENRPNGEPFLINLSHRHIYTNDILHHTYTNWLNCVNSLFSANSVFQEYDVIYAHNGCGWDWLSLIDFLRENYDKTSIVISCSMAGSKMIFVRVTINGVTKTLVDSLHILQCSLDTAGYKWLGVGKMDIGCLPHELPATKAIEYCRTDCEVLLKVLEQFYQVVCDKIAPIKSLGVTLPSTALKIYRTAFQDRDIFIPEDAELKKLLREGYKGGRVECFQPGHYESVNEYDINSMYPYVMANTKLPYTACGEWVKEFNPDGCGVYRIRFQQLPPDIPILLDRGNGVLNGEGVYFTPEIQLLLERGGRIDVIRGYEFSDTDYILADYVKTLYELRCNNKDIPLGDVCKLLLNSLYGKFGINPERETIVFFNTEQDFIDSVDIDRITDYSELSEGSLIFSKTERIRCIYEHVGIAGMITSAARAYLYRMFPDDVIYCDTDSVHCQSELPTGTELGQFKHVFSGEGVYVGKKMYGLRDIKGEKIRVKGVTVGGKFGTQLHFDDLVNVLHGNPKRCDFRKPTTPREVWAGGKSCVFINRHRTIRNLKNV